MNTFTKETIYDLELNGDIALRMWCLEMALEINEDVMRKADDVYQFITSNAAPAKAEVKPPQDMPAPVIHKDETPTFDEAVELAVMQVAEPAKTPPKKTSFKPKSRKLGKMEKLVLKVCVKAFHEGVEDLNGAVITRDYFKRSYHITTINAHLRELKRLGYIRREGRRVVPMFDENREPLVRKPAVTICPPAQASGYRPFAQALGKIARVK